MPARRSLTAATVLGLALAATASPAAHAAGSMVLYKVKVGIKGGAHLTTDKGGRYPGDMVQETLGASLSVDGTLRPVVVWRGTPPGGTSPTGDAYARAVVNGTWSAQGTKWLDPAKQLTAPFTCGGTIGPTVTPQMHLHSRSSGAKVTFTLAVLQQELYLNGFTAGCPNDTSPAPLHGTSPAIYSTRFSIPRSAIGGRTITRQVSGPLPANRVFWRQSCPSGSDCSVAWQGTVRFTRTSLRG